MGDEGRQGVEEMARRGRDTLASGFIRVLGCQGEPTPTPTATVAPTSTATPTSSVQGITTPGMRLRIVRVQLEDAVEARDSLLVLPEHE